VRTSSTPCGKHIRASSAVPPAQHTRSRTPCDTLPSRGEAECLDAARAKNGLRTTVDGKTHASHLKLSYATSAGVADRNFSLMSMVSVTNLRTTKVTTLRRGAVSFLSSVHRW
jgi:hypothetical protein